MERGHNVTLLTHCCYEKLAHDAGLGFRAWETPEQYSEFIENLNAEIDSIRSLDAIDAFRHKYESNEIRLSEYEKIVSCCDSQDTVIVAKNRSSLSAFLAAEKLALPIACVFMNPLEIHSMITFHNLFSDKLKREANELRRELKLPPVTSWMDWQSSTNMNIALWPEWFSPVGEGWRKPIIPVGFPIPDPYKADQVPVTPDMQHILNDQEKPILISGGTGKMIKPEFYPVSVEACRLSGKKAILLTRYEEMVPKNMHSSIQWVKHIPNLSSVMHTMGAVIHHGGIGTLSGAAMAGTPQLILGHYVDRPLNGARAKELGIAEYLPPALWEPEIISQSISKITSYSFTEGCKKFARNINKAENPIKRVCTMLEEIVDHHQYRIDVPLDQSFSSKELSNEEHADERDYGDKLRYQKIIKDLSAAKRALLLDKLHQRDQKNHYQG